MTGTVEPTKSVRKFAAEDSERRGAGVAGGASGKGRGARTPLTLVSGNATSVFT